MQYSYSYSAKTVQSFWESYPRVTRFLAELSGRFSYPRICRIFQHDQDKWNFYKTLVKRLCDRMNQTTVELSIDDWKGIVLNICLVLAEERGRFYKEDLGESPKSPDLT